MKTPDQGFSLIELTIVMAVIAILAAMAYPSYARQTVKARRVEAQLALVEAMQLQEQYRAQHHTYLAFSSSNAGDPDARQFRWWLGDDPASSPYELDAYACPGQVIEACVELRARPGTDRVDSGFSDPDCGTLTYNSAGEAGASGEGERCWP
jgi:type IV pilus assembly protein PilE